MEIPLYIPDIIYAYIVGFKYWFYVLSFSMYHSKIEAIFYRLKPNHPLPYIIKIDKTFN